MCAAGERTRRGARSSPATLILLALLVIPGSASASTGLIEGLSIEPSLHNATVQNLGVNFDRCSSPEDAGCAWSATAYLAAPPRISCPPSSSSLAWSAENPPGLPGPPTLREVWTRSSYGDGTLQSGPLQLTLGGVDDQYLCLYASSSVPIAGQPSTAVGSPPADTTELLASQLLHVDPVPSEPAPPTEPPTTRPCKKHQVRRHSRCVPESRRHHRRHHRRHR
jgi:hypothetical protein